MTSWQVRLGNLDEEIQDFLEENPEYPIKDEREFVKNAVRQEMKDWVNQNTEQDIEKIVDRQVEEKLS